MATIDKIDTPCQKGQQCNCKEYRKAMYGFTIMPIGKCSIIQFFSFFSENSKCGISYFSVSLFLYQRPASHICIWSSLIKYVSLLMPQDILVIRKIHPCLPSFKSEFTASVPLTRIRDIAHRNDIPHDLKVISRAILGLNDLHPR